MGEMAETSEVRIGSELFNQKQKRMKSNRDLTVNGFVRHAWRGPLERMLLSQGITNEERIHDYM